VERLNSVAPVIFAKVAPLRWHFATAQRTSIARPTACAPLIRGDVFPAFFRRIPASPNSDNFPRMPYYGIEVH
jgi:hypothetical protein